MNLKCGRSPIRGISADAANRGASPVFCSFPAFGVGVAIGVGIGIGFFAPDPDPDSDAEHFELTKACK